MIPTITLEEFECQYAERSGVTVEWLHAQGRFGVPCDCGEEGCRGWEMTTKATPIGIGVVEPPADLHVTGKVQYGELKDDEGNPLLTVPLLEPFEGKRIEITVRILK